MMTALYQRIHRLATWSVVALLSVAIVLCVQGFIWRQAALGWSNQVLDARLGYTPAEAQQVLAAMGAPGRHLYATTQLTLDVIFPLVYGLFFAVLMVRLYRLEQAKILFAPLLMVVADLAENVLTTMLAWSYTGQISALAWLAAGCTAVKWIALVITLVLLILGGVRGLRAPSQAG